MSVSLRRRRMEHLNNKITISMENHRPEHRSLSQDIAAATAISEMRASNETLFVDADGKR